MRPAPERDRAFFHGDLDLEYGMRTRWSITAVLLLIRRHHMRISDAALRRELEQIEREQRSIDRDRS